MTRWCHNAKTGEIFSYNQEGDYTDFPRGDYLVYGDYLTTGFASKAGAVEYARTHGACHKCKGSTSPDTTGKCFRCGGDVEFVQAKEQS